MVFPYLIRWVKFDIGVHTYDLLVWIVVIFLEMKSIANGLIVVLGVCLSDDHGMEWNKGWAGNILINWFLYEE